MDLAGAGLTLRLRWWTRPKRSDVVSHRDQVLQRAKEQLLAAGIDLPFPTQQILWRDQTEIADGDHRRRPRAAARGLAPAPRRQPCPAHGIRSEPDVRRMGSDESDVAAMDDVRGRAALRRAETGAFFACVSHARPVSGLDAGAGGP